MGENSAIEWTHHTFNPWEGCTKVSPGCDNCYAEHDTPCRVHAVLWGNHPRRRTAASTWKKPRTYDRKAVKQGVRFRVFCASLADVFDNQVPEDWRADLWKLIAETPHLDWLLLTKRPQNIHKMLPARWADGWPNVWIGTTVENQEEADRRIPYLLAVPAAVRFLSCEPLLGPIELARWLHEGIHWVIVGGESGSKRKRRPMDLAWARAIRDQCEAAGIPFFGKQLDKVEDLPADLMVRQFPRAALPR